MPRYSSSISPLSGFGSLIAKPGTPTAKASITSKLFASVRGRMFGAWIDADSRDNGYDEGDVIENPAYIIESILRDELSRVSANIDHASIDAIGNTTTGKRDGWSFARSLFSVDGSLNTTAELCNEAGLVGMTDGTNKQRLVALADYAPSDVLSSAHIAEDGGRPLIVVRQTPVKYICNEFYLNYKYNYGSGNLDRQRYITSAGQNLTSNSRNDGIAAYGGELGVCADSQTKYNTTRRWTFDSYWIRDDATADLFIKLMADWLCYRHFEIEATLWFSPTTLKLEVMDQVLWNHSLLPVSLTTQKVLSVARGGSAGGSLTGTHYYVVSALDSFGATIKSDEVSYTVAGGNATCTVSWDELPGAASYRVYRGTSAGAENEYFDVSDVEFVDDGTVTKTGDGSPETKSNAWFVTNVINGGLNGGWKLQMKFLSLPRIFSR